MTTLHMETDTVRAMAGQLKRATEQAREQATQVNGAAQSMDWLGASRDEFVAEMDAVFRSLSAQLDVGETLAGRVESEVSEWEQVASSLGGTGEFLPQFRSDLLAAVTVLSGGGAVLGASTMADSLNLSTADYAAQYQNMKWGDKFAEQSRIDAEIAKVSDIISKSRSQAQIDADLSDAEKQIAEIEAARKKAQENADNSLNKIMPDVIDDSGGFNPFQDDKNKTDWLPWRVKADDYKDEVAGYDAQLAPLYARRDALLKERTTLQTNLSSFDQLKAQGAAMSSVIAGGIPSDGPTKPDWYKNGFGGCTNYVAEKRGLYVSKDVRINGNAQDWKQSAIDHGWDVGKYPAKGSAMVFQGEASKDYGTANRDVGGHVAYVENVEKAANGAYKVTISEASTIYKDGKFVPGVHTKVTTRTVEVPANGHTYVDFIYDRR